MERTTTTTTTTTTTDYFQAKQSSSESIDNVNKNKGGLEKDAWDKDLKPKDGWAKLQAAAKVLRKSPICANLDEDLKTCKQTVKTYQDICSNFSETPDAELLAKWATASHDAVVTWVSGQVIYKMETVGDKQAKRTQVNDAMAVFEEYGVEESSIRKPLLLQVEKVRGFC